MVGPEEALHGLKLRLKTLRRGESWAQFARRIHVAPKTLMDVLKAEPGAYKGATEKQAVGRAETLSRIVRFINQGADRPINLTAVLDALGIETVDVHPAMGLDRLATIGMQDEDILFRTHGDVVLGRIEQRKLAGDPHPIKAGIDRWAPFWPPDEDMESSFAGIFMRRLLGCLNPLDWGNPELKPLGFAEASDANCVRTGKYDALFSVYDIPSRRLSGYEFIRLPGLRGALGALTFGFDHEASWESILDRDELADPSLKVFVITGEVGDFFLSGSCDYREGQITRLARSVNAREIVDRLWSFIRSRLESNRQLTPFLFCADDSITRKVEEELREVLHASTSEMALHLPKKLKRVDPDKLFSPYYPLGIAVNGRASRWIEILRDTLQTELFVNGGALTAKHYVKMLARSDAETIQIVSLESDLPIEVATKFAEHVRLAIPRFGAKMPDERKQKLAAWSGVPEPKPSVPNETPLRETVAASASRETAKHQTKARTG